LTQTEPNYSWYYQLLLFTISPSSLIDLAAIIPSYFRSSSAKSNTFVRVLKITRVFRLFKILKFGHILDLVQDTIGVIFRLKDSMIFHVNSFNDLQRSGKVLIFLMVTEVIGALFFGCLIYIFEQGTYTVNSSYPTGAYVRINPFQSGGFESSPFTIIYSCFYWAIITLTTVYCTLIHTSHI